MDQGDYGEAVKSLEEQYKLHPDNMGILAQLVIAYAKVSITVVIRSFYVCHWVTMAFVCDFSWIWHVPNS